MRNALARTSLVTATAAGLIAATVAPASAEVTFWFNNQTVNGVQLNIDSAASSPPPNEGINGGVGFWNTTGNFPTQPGNWGGVAAGADSSVQVPAGSTYYATGVSASEYFQDSSIFTFEAVDPLSPFSPATLTTSAVGGFTTCNPGTGAAEYTAECTPTSNAPNTADLSVLATTAPALVAARSGRAAPRRVRARVLVMMNSVKKKHVRAQVVLRSGKTVLGKSTLRLTDDKPALANVKLSVSAARKIAQGKKIRATVWIRAIDGTKGKSHKMAGLVIVKQSLTHAMAKLVRGR